MTLFLPLFGQTVSSSSGKGLAGRVLNFHKTFSDSVSERRSVPHNAGTVLYTLSWRSALDPPSEVPFVIDHRVPKEFHSS